MVNTLCSKAKQIKKNKINKIIFTVYYIAASY